MNNAVEVKNLSKRYTIGQKERYLTLRDLFVKAAKAPINLAKGKKFAKKEQFWALKDVNFEVKEGEVVGIIGRNGAGKSTLLKILSRITEPTEGEVKLNGRVSSLLEVGTGFHPELTGRENIYLNGAILGMRKKEIDEKFDEIVEFSGVEKFLDMPVKRFSSGMQVRLAFSIAAHLEPDILIIDEVLAVGDAEFQKKCLGKMDQVTKEAGRTILFVSHDMRAIRKLCQRVILLENGSIAQEGPVEDVIAHYYDRMRVAHVNKLEERQDRSGRGEVKFVEVGFRDSNGDPLADITSGAGVQIHLRYRSVKEETLRNCRSSVIITDKLGQDIIKLSTLTTENKYIDLPPQGELVCEIKKLPLTPGEYMLKPFLEVDGVVQDDIENAGVMNVLEGSFFGGRNEIPEGWEGKGVLVEHSWRFS